MLPSVLVNLDFAASGVAEPAADIYAFVLPILRTDRRILSITRSVLHALPILRKLYARSRR